MNYLKQNHLSLLSLALLAVLYFMPAGEGIFGGANSPKTNLTNPIVFQERIAVASGATGTPSTLYDVNIGTKNATSSIYMEKPCFAFKLGSNGGQILYYTPATSTGTGGSAWATSTSPTLCQ